MTAQDQAELRVLLRWIRAGLITGILAIFAAGVLWASMQDKLNAVPVLADAIATLQQERDSDRAVMRDFMMLSCARGNLNNYEQAICARYNPRMPR